MISKGIRLISLNIEGDNHYDKIFPFFEKEKPDVICLQEVFAVDLPLFEEKLGMVSHHLAQSSIVRENPYRLAVKGPTGVAILTNLNILDVQKLYYVKHAETPPEGGSEPNSGNRPLLVVDVTKEEMTYRVITTHFTWAPDGGVSDLQRDNVQKMFAQLDRLGEFILTGDFNAPRGQEIFDAIASRYTDNIPSEVTTTLDPSLHRAGNVLQPLVVDGLFTTPSYTAKLVRVVKGVSDHCGIVGTITKTYYDSNTGANREE